RTVSGRARRAGSFARQCRPEKIARGHYPAPPPRVTFAKQRLSEARVRRPAGVVEPGMTEGTGGAARERTERMSMRCRAFGHDYAFHAEGSLMRWTCTRGCEAGGVKRYASAQEAQRYATAFDRRDTENLGRRAPLLGLFPLWL